MLTIFSDDDLTLMALLTRVQMMALCDITCEEWNQSFNLWFFKWVSKYDVWLDLSLPLSWDKRISLSLIDQPIKHLFKLCQICLISPHTSPLLTFHQIKWPAGKTICLPPFLQDHFTDQVILPGGLWPVSSGLGGVAEVEVRVISSCSLFTAVRWPYTGSFPGQMTFSQNTENLLLCPTRWCPVYSYSPKQSNLLCSAFVAVTWSPDLHFLAFLTLSCNSSIFSIFLSSILNIF